MTLTYNVSFFLSFYPSFFPFFPSFPSFLSFLSFFLSFFLSSRALALVLRSVIISHGAGKEGVALVTSLRDDAMKTMRALASSVCVTGDVAEVNRFKVNRL